MLCQILSDLHLETQPSYDFKFKKTAPYLALLGDIGQVNNEQLFQFLEKQLSRFWAVFFLLGNHEPYYLSYEEAKTRVRAFAERVEKLRMSSTIGRFVFLDQTRHDTGNLTLLGCTLFSHVSPEQEHAVAGRLMDFQRIQQWTVQNHNAAHRSDLNWLNNEVAKIAEKEPHRRIAILTHHSPCTDPRAVDPAHKDSEVTTGFATDLSAETCWTHPGVKSWAFGHTHFNCAFATEDDGGPYLLSNQRGYRLAPVPTFDAARVFNLGE